MPKDRDLQALPDEPGKIGTHPRDYVVFRPSGNVRLSFPAVSDFAAVFVQRVRADGSPYWERVTDAS